MKAPFRERLELHGQEHLLTFWEQLSAAEQDHLARQIRSLDFGLIERLVRGHDESEDWSQLASRARPPRTFRLDGRGNEFSRAVARQAGEAALAAGRVGALLVAGGQGTRLGFEHPKGMYPIGPVSGVSLFQLLVEKLRATSRRYGVRIPLWLMTSPATHHETAEFFERHGRFGLPPEDLHLFCQGTMPAVDAQTGRVLLAEPAEIALSPDGHGGSVAALKAAGGLDLARQRGIDLFFYFQVDNPLVVVCDPVFLGYHLLAGAEVSTQVVRKVDPAERVGLVVEIDGRVRIIEYSDLPAEVAARRTPDGGLELWAGNIAVHVFDREFLERMSAGDGRLPFHRARKKVPFVDEDGRLVDPETPNALKFERFVFDLLPAAERSMVMEVAAEEAFAPLKNADDAPRDSAPWVRRQMLAQAARWLAAGGVQVADGVQVEISPLFALDAEELAARIPRGTRITETTYLAKAEAAWSPAGG